MKKITLFLSAFLFCSGSITAYAQTADNGAQTLELYFFGSNTCGECLEIKQSLLKPLEQQYGSKLTIRYHDIEDPESYELMLRIEKQYGIASKDASPQELFFPDTALLGYSSIMANGRRMVEEYVNDPAKQVSIAVSGEAGDVDDALMERFKSFTLAGIIAAALVDAINPCAIATMIFLISFLTTQKRKRSEILTVGLAFSAAVFTTYLLLGIGAFKVITALEQYYWVSRGIKWIAVALAGTIGVISFVDAMRFKKSGDVKKIKLQLPKSIKLRIHKVITQNIQGKRLIIGTVITGFLVTLLEAVCTGQVYLPTIVLMTRSGGSGSVQLMGWFYLILYNFIFVVPLLAVMIAAYCGMRWNTLAKMTQNNLTLLKILLGFVMIGLALFLAFA